MVIRMQGFDEGVFGGHFHTANAPPVFGIPGLDVLCYSNGRDWARGLHGTLAYAERGGVSMLLDSTALLHRKHLVQGDGAWLTAYPDPASTAPLSADTVMLYSADAPPNQVTLRG